MKPIQFEITRSFSKKVQVAQYEPEEYFCGAKAIFSEIPSDEKKEEISKELDDFCRKEVMRSQEITANAIREDQDRINAANPLD